MSTVVYTASRHNTVNVRMVEQIGSPRMEDGSHAGCEPLLGSKGINSSPCCFEHAVVEDTLMSHCNRMQARRHRENDMEVFDRDNLFPAEFNPLLTFLVLTFGTMPVTTAVVADMHIPAFGTHLHMSAKGTGMALRHVPECSFNRRNDMMLAKKLSTVVWLVFLLWVYKEYIMRSLYQIFDLLPHYFIKARNYFPLYLI